MPPCTTNVPRSNGLSICGDLSLQARQNKSSVPNAIPIYAVDRSPASFPHDGKFTFVVFSKAKVPTRAPYTASLNYSKNSKVEIARELSIAVLTAITVNTFYYDLDFSFF